MQPARSFPQVDNSGLRPVIRGTGIKISLIASEFEHLGMTPDEIVEAHPHISLSDVHAALAYYYANPRDIQREWEEGRAIIAEMRARFPRHPKP